jgi:hypothetical protein
MAIKVTPPINSFNSGEISPLLDARIDVSKFASGCRTLENAFPLVEGGAKKMPGTKYVSVAGSAGKSRLVPFIFNENQAYVLEFYEKGIRVCYDEGILQGNTTVTDYSHATAYVEGDVVQVGNYWWLGFPSSKSFSISAPYGEQPWFITITVKTNVTDDLSVFTVDGAPYAWIMIMLANTTPSKNSAANIEAAIQGLGTWINPLIHGGQVDLSEWIVTPNAAYLASPPVSGDTTGTFHNEQNQYQALSANQNSCFPPQNLDYWTLNTQSLTPADIIVETPYLEEDLFDLDVGTQSADVLYIFHNKYPAARLERRSATNWQLVTVNFMGTTDVADMGYTGIARAISGITNASPAVVKCAFHGFQDGDTVYINHVIGMLELNQGKYLVGYIDYANFELYDFNTANEIDSTDFGEYVDGGSAVKVVSLFNTEGEYPACGTFFEQRLIMSGFPNHPERLVGSVMGDFHNFISDPEADDYAIQFDLTSQRVDPAIWMAAQNKLALGTEGGIWIVSGSNGGPLTQTSVDAKKVITTGAGKVAPQIVNDTIIWATRITRIVRILQYEFSSDKFIAPDLTRIARHIAIGENKLQSGIIQTAYQQEPFPIFWALRADGQLLGMTFESQDQVYAWFRVVTQGRFESICVIPKPNNEEQIWVIANRS